MTCHPCLPQSPKSSVPISPLLRRTPSGPPASPKPEKDYISRRRDEIKRQSSGSSASGSSASSTKGAAAATSDAEATSTHKLANGTLFMFDGGRPAAAAPAVTAATSPTPAAAPAPPDAAQAASSSTAMATATEPSTPLVPVVTSCASNGSSQASVGAEGSAVLTEASLSHRYNDGRSEGVGLVGPVETPFATVTLEQFDELTVPRLYIQTRKGTIDEESIGQVLGCLDDVLARGHPLTITYDLRTAPLPSRKQIGIGLDWIAANGPKLDVQLQGVAIVLSSAIVRGVVNFVLHLTQPPQPNGCFGDEPSAFAFARDKCTEVRVWVPARKLKRQQSMDATTEAAVDGTPPKQSPRRWMSGFSAGFTPSSRASSAEVEAEESPERPDLKRASTAW